MRASRGPAAAARAPGRLRAAAMGLLLTFVSFVSFFAAVAPCAAQTPPLVPLAGVTEVAAGGYHNCALVGNGSVVCWGLNDSGQLGDGSTASRTTPVAVVGRASGGIAVAAGGSHSCAVASDGNAWCWGANSNGQLGTGGSAPSTIPAAVANPSSSRVWMTAIAAGWSHSCALAGGAVLCWGLNKTGQLGNGTTVDRFTPTPVSGLSGVVAVAAGAMHTCALTSAGTVWCWGDNSQHQIDDSGVTRLVPTAVPGVGSGVKAIATGAYHTCAALTDSGSVRCWGGSNGYGQLGTAAMPVSPVDVTVSSVPVLDVAAGASHSCALDQLGIARCWGSNDFGQLGGGRVGGSSTTPVSVTGLSGTPDAVLAGSNHSCAATNEGGVQCWGWNAAGTLGDGTTTDRASAAPVLTASVASKLALRAPATAAAGAPFTVFVAAMDAAGNAAIGYDGSVQVTSSDGGATLPASGVVLANGVGSFTATLRGGGTQTLTATDAANAALKGTSDAIAVASIGAFTPSSGGVGAAVTITGTGLADASGVSFNGVRAPFTVISPTTLVSAVPLGATTGPIAVTVPAGTVWTSTNFTAGTSKVTAKISAFTPSSGAVGTTVTITGTDLGGATQVTFGGVGAAFRVLSASSLAAVVPAGAITGKIGVVTAGGTGSSGSSYTVLLPPSITSFTPTSGAVGSTVVITGARFTGATAVSFNGTPATYTVSSSTSISAKVPMGATSGAISVTGPVGAGTATSAAAFTVTVVPYTLSVARSGTGAVSSYVPNADTAAPGIACGTACSASFSSGSTVTLNATADAGWVFAGWTGACTGKAVTCTVAMTGNTSASASFLRSTTLAYTGSTKAAKGTAVTLSATLASVTGPLSGTTVKFALNGKTYSATTNAAGVASVAATAPGSLGTYPITATYAGSTTYAAASVTASLVTQ